MNDPHPANIQGQKRVVHKVEHRINWGYVAAGVGLFVLAWVVSGMLQSSSDDETGFDGGAANSEV
jgi:hypothetical protein